MVIFKAWWPVGIGMGRKSWMRVLGASLAVILSAVSVASGQQWAVDMFNHTTHDFGTVARGAKVEHRFPVENIYLEDAHIVSARVSCGCTSPEVPTRILKTWDKADVIARVDTAAFLGQKDVTITVTFDRPFPAEVQLQIHCYIRSDVVVQPGLVQFGSVAQGTALQQKVTISYAGRSDWQIQRVECTNPSLTAQAVEVARGGGLVTYDLYVSLAANAPPGYIRDQLYLVTNDLNPRSVRVPVPVEGAVQSALAVHPSPLYMGHRRAGKVDHPATRGVRQCTVSSRSRRVDESPVSMHATRCRRACCSAFRSFSKPATCRERSSAECASRLIPARRRWRCQSTSM